MRNYLSQIVAKTNGIPESIPIKPGIRSWPPSHSEKSSDPFEEVVEPLRDINRPEFSPGQTASLENTDSLTPNQGSEEMISPGKTAEQFHIPLAQSARLMPYIPFPDSTVSLSPSGKENKFVNIEQSIVDGKPESNEQPALRHTEKPGKVIFDSENQAPVGPVFVETNVTHEQFAKQDQHAELSLKEVRPKIRQPDEPPVESLKHSSPEPLTPGALVSFSRKTEETNQSTDMPVSELRPRPAGISIQPSIPKMENKEQRLVIGRLKVEVVAPPVTTKQATVRTTTPHTGKSQPRREVSNSHYKLRFGLGQM